MEANERKAEPESVLTTAVSAAKPLWALDIVEITGHNIETRGRAEVNRLLQGDGCCFMFIL